jgi:hypothetical protein
MHRPVFYLKLYSIGLSVPHRKHVTSPLQAQEVNAVFRFVTTVYTCKYHDSGLYSDCRILFKTRPFGHCILSSKGGIYSVAPIT